MPDPHPAFSSRSDCPIPYIPEIELDLIQDCVIPPVPDPFFEMAIFPPLVPPVTIGCPKIKMKTRQLIGRPSKIVPKTRNLDPKVLRQDGKDDCFPYIRLDFTLPCVLAKNMSPTIAEPPCPMEVTGVTEYNGMEVLEIDVPSEDSVPASRIVFPIDPILAYPQYQYGCVHEGYDLILVSYTGDDPVKDDEMGVVANSCDFKKGNTGFVAVAVKPAEKLAWVRPQTGGGAAFQVAQATEDGSGGKVKAKAIQFLADLSASPNFEQVGDEFEAKYFKL